MICFGFVSSGWKLQPVHSILEQDIASSGDGAEFQDRDTLKTISFGGVLGGGVTLDTCCYITSWPGSCTSKDKRNEEKDTWAKLWKQIVYGFRACFDGFLPDKGYDGKPYGAGIAKRGNRQTHLAVWALT